MYQPTDVPPTTLVSQTRGAPTVPSDCRSVNGRQGGKKDKVQALAGEQQGVGGGTDIRERQGQKRNQSQEQSPWTLLYNMHSNPVSSQSLGFISIVSMQPSLQYPAISITNTLLATLVCTCLLPGQAQLLPFQSVRPTKWFSSDPSFHLGHFERYPTGRYVPWSVSGLIDRWRHADETLLLTSVADELCSDHHNCDRDDNVDEINVKCLRKRNANMFHATPDEERKCCRFFICLLQTLPVRLIKFSFSCLS